MSFWSSVLPSFDGSIIETAQKGAANGGVPPVSDEFAELLQKYQQTGDAQLISDFLSSKGGNWEKLVQANPWSQQQYHQTGFQKFLSKLGFRTGYDTFLESQQFGSNQYLADLMQQYYQQEFNKPLSQVEQMREAGQNPDLLGTGDVQNAPQNATDNDAVPSEVFRSQEMNDLASMGSMIQGTVNLFSGAIGSVFQMVNAAEDLRSKHIANGNGLVDMAKKLITDFSPTDLGLLPEDSTATSDVTWATLPQDAFEGANVRNIARNIAAKNLGIRRKDIPRVITLMKEMYPQLGGQIAVHEGQVKLGTAKHENLIMQGDAFYNPRGWNIEQQYKFIKPFAEMQQHMTETYLEIQKKYQALEKQSQHLQAVQTGNQIEYESAFNATSAAEAANVSNELAKLKSEFFKTMQEEQNACLAKVKREADAGDRWSKVLYFMLIASGFITSTGVGQVIGATTQGVSNLLGSGGKFLSGLRSGPALHSGPTFINSYH